MVRPEFVGPWSVNKGRTFFSFYRLKLVLSNVLTFIPVMFLAFKEKLRDHTHGFLILSEKEKGKVMLLTSPREGGKKKENGP